MSSPAPVTITSALEAIWADDAEPILIAALAASGPLGASIASILKIPVIGSLLTQGINYFVDKLIAGGVIEIKLGILDFLSLKAQAKYAPQIAILRAAQSQDTLTPEQEADYEKALQGIVQNHPGVAGA